MTEETKITLGSAAFALIMTVVIVGVTGGLVGLINNYTRAYDEININQYKQLNDQCQQFSTETKKLYEKSQEDGKITIEEYIQINKLYENSEVPLRYFEEINLNRIAQYRFDEAMKDHIMTRSEYQEILKVIDFNCIDEDEEYDE